MLYDTFNYHILHFLKLIIVHHDIVPISLSSHYYSTHNRSVPVRHYDKMVHRMTNVP